MKRFFLVAMALWTLTAFPATGENKPGVKTELPSLSPEDDACDLVKQFAAKLDGLPKSGPPMGWDCDFSSNRNPTLYVISLHSRRDDDGSSLMGWYAVRKKTGEVGEFDVVEEKMITRRH